MGENICQQSNRQRTNLQNTQRAHGAQYQKKKNPIKKWAKDPKQTFLQRRHTDGEEAHEKIFSITNYQRSADQNYNEI